MFQKLNLLQVLIEKLQIKVSQKRILTTAINQYFINNSILKLSFQLNLIIIKNQIKFQFINN